MKKLPGWLVPLLVALAVISAIIANRAATPLPPTLEELRQQLRDLQRQGEQSQGSDLNAKIVTLEKKIEEKQLDLHLREYGRAKEKEVEDLKQKARQEQADIEQAREDEIAFRKHCEAVEEKKISDLTVKDAEDLKSCGVTIPRVIP